MKNGENMRRGIVWCWLLIAGMALALPAFGADSGTLPTVPPPTGFGNPAGDVYGEIVRHVWDDTLVLPKNPEECADALYAWQNAEEACGDTYARRLSAAEVAAMNEEQNTPVLWGMRGTVGIIRFNAFGEDTNENVMARALFLLEEQDAQALELDLRDNRGGAVPAALKILYLFARERDRFATFRYRSKIEIHDAASVKTEFELTYPPGILRKIPTAVRINGESASAAEMVAGTMKDWGYSVHGTVSYKKGIGQGFFKLPDGSFIRLTTFEFFVGNSQTKIHGIGVIPTHPLPEEIRE